MKNLNLLLAISLLLLPHFVCGQHTISEKVQKNITSIRQAAQYTPLAEVAADAPDNTPFISETLLSDKQFFQVRNQPLKSIREKNKEYVRMTIPIEGQNVELELVKAKIFTDDFRVVAASNPGVELDIDRGTHYWGTVKGADKSLVAISFLENEIMGLINFNGNQYTLGKVKNSDHHILYEKNDLNYTPEHSCTAIPVNDNDITIDETAIQKSSFAPCVRIHMEVDYSFYQDQGSIAATTNTMNGIFAEVAVIYANENINIQLSYLNIWDTPSPYSGDKLDAITNQGYLDTYGDLVHLVHGDGGGGVAWLDVLCGSSRNTGVSGIYGQYSSVPTYSFDVFLISHELGHNFGSPHTHDCEWNGNNTAIDNCSQSGCGGSTPQNGGTIMSYCNDVNFNEGFGPQPGDLIRNRYAAASCLQECGDPAQCDDGVQNGNETGIDCGGICPPCPCDGNAIFVNITPDNYPQETSWEITDENGATVASGGAGGNQNLCLEDGCYTFTISDSFNDGICCDFGNGSYNVVDVDGNTLASGGEFGSSESTDFCLNGGGGGGSEPTCDDGIQNGDETGIDCGGDCPPCPPNATCTDGVQNGNETGVDCGGDCPPCDCNGSTIVASINLDNYPLETSWSITNENGATVSSGGTYGNQPASSTVTESLCLEDGCYTFTISDSYNDGICCGYGNGSYNVVDADGNTLASGGEFGSSESTDFCLTGGGASCDDGIQNGDETGVDCGGDCAACPTCDDGVQNGDETDVDCGGDCAACPTCDDGVQNGDETDVDCGGDCAACPTCDDGVQNGDETDVDCGGDCAACPTCDDGVQNGDETDVDCGGDCAACPTCDDGVQNGDETDVDCGGSDCVACPTCDDGVQNGDETDVDCGGSCSECEPDCEPGSPCDDDDVCTINDALDENCECVGVYTDSDDDRTCDALDDCPFDPTDTCDEGIPDYCASQGNNSYYEYIDRVIFGNVDNTSGDNGGYGDYTDQIATVGTGDLVPLGLTPGFPRIPYDEAWNVWIDFNQDGIFDDLTESVYYGISAGTLSGNVTIPDDATLGLTGMRVSMQWQRLPLPCESVGYGEVEDYVVNITDVPQNYDPVELRNEAGLSAGPAFRISPNPATDFVDVNLQDAREGGAVEVITVSGQILWQQAIGAETTNLRIPLENLPAGVYFIRLNFGSSNYVTERFVKLTP